MLKKRYINFPSYNLTDLREFIFRFRIFCDVFADMDNSNCSNKEQFIGCHDGYCIPASLKCNQEENCGEGYDEDCYLGINSFLLLVCSLSLSPEKFIGIYPMMQYSGIFREITYVKIVKVFSHINPFYCRVR